MSWETVIGLEVHVQLGLGNHVILPAMTGRSAGAAL